MVILDLACGKKKQEGAIGVDKYQCGEVDIVHDLLTYPWPFEDNSIDAAYCSHFFEHIPGKERPKFMDELYRVLKPEATAVIVVPPFNSDRAYQDYTHEWPPVAPSSMHYFNRPWRELQQLDYGDYDIKSNFEIEAGANLSEEWKQRAVDARNFAAKHYVNTTTDLIFKLTKKE